MNVEAICGPKLQIYNVARSPGSVLHGNIFRNSRLYMKMETGGHRGRPSGDVVYPCKPFLFTIENTLQLETSQRELLVNEMGKAVTIAAAILHKKAVKANIPLTDNENNVPDH